MLASFQVGSDRIAAHRFILANKSEYFRKLFYDRPPNETPEPVSIDLHGVSAPLFRQLLKFIYTDTCDLLMPGVAVAEVVPDCTPAGKNGDAVDELSYDLADDMSWNIIEPAHSKKKSTSAYAVYQATKKTNKKVAKQNANLKSVSAISGGAADPIQGLKELAKEYSIKELAKR